MNVFAGIETTQSWHTQLLSECITRNLFNGHLDDRPRWRFNNLVFIHE